MSRPFFTYQLEHAFFLLALRVNLMVAEQDNAFQDERLEYHLQVQANQIQSVLTHHETSTMITGGIINNRSFNFDLRSPITVGLEKLSSLKDDFKTALGVEGIRLNRQNGQLQLQVIRPFTPAVPLVDLLSRLHNNPPASAVLGYAEDGSVIRHDFTADATPNILISGAKDAGKTNLLRTIAVSLALTNRQADVQIVAINPTSADSQNRDSEAAFWRPLNYVPHMLTDVVSRQTEISELLLFMVREMNYRSEHLFSSPRIVVLIDQAATVMERGGRTVSEAILRIAERGAGAGIHLVLGTSRPQSGQFGPHLLTNLQSHYAGFRNQNSERQDDDITARAATLLGQGDFLSCGFSPQLRFQAAFIDDYDLHMGLSKLYRKRPILLAQPLSTRKQLNPSIKPSTLEQHFAFADGIVAVS